MNERCSLHGDLLEVDTVPVVKCIDLSSLSLEQVAEIQRRREQNSPWANSAVYSDIPGGTATVRYCQSCRTAAMQAADEARERVDQMLLRLQEAEGTSSRPVGNE